MRGMRGRGGASGARGQPPAFPALPRGRSPDNRGNSGGNDRRGRSQGRRQASRSNSRGRPVVQSNSAPNGFELGKHCIEWLKTGRCERNDEGKCRYEHDSSHAGRYGGLIVNFDKPKCACGAEVQPRNDGRGWLKTCPTCFQARRDAEQRGPGATARAFVAASPPGASAPPATNEAMAPAGIVAFFPSDLQAQANAQARAAQAAQAAREAAAAGPRTQVFSDGRSGGANQAHVATLYTAKGVRYKAAYPDQ